MSMLCINPLKLYVVVTVKKIPCREIKDLVTSEMKFILSIKIPMKPNMMLLNRKLPSFRLNVDKRVIERIKSVFVFQTKLLSITLQSCSTSTQRIVTNKKSSL